MKKIGGLLLNTHHRNSHYLTCMPIICKEMSTEDIHEARAKLQHNMEVGKSIQTFMINLLPPTQ